MLDPHTNPQHGHPFLFNSGPEKRSDTYDTWQPINYSSRAEKTAQNYKSWKSMGAVRLNAAEESPSGVCSPPLWKTTATSPPRSPSRSLNNYRSLSPASRTQAIARGQREMMEMVRNMPESCYELSLKDLVERRTMVDVEVDDEDASTEILVKRKDGKLKKKIDMKKPMVMRSGSIDSGGFLLKMVFPISLGSNKKNKITMINKNKKNKSDCVVEDRVSPKPCVDKDWWKKKVSASGESGGSESGVSSIISGSIKSSSGSSTSSCSSRSSSRYLRFSIDFKF